MWIQPIDPLNNIVLSSILGSTPIIVLVAMLTVLKTPGYKASFYATLVAFTIAVLVWGMPVEAALASYFYGVLFGLWPITWIIVNAMALFSIVEKTGCLRDLEEWLKQVLPRDKRIQAIFVAYLFGGLIEGVDGFGFPIAISSALLVAMGLDPFRAVAVSLIANTITVPYASLGVPLITLGIVTGLDLYRIAVYSSLQLLAYSIAIPFIIACMIDCRKLGRVALLTALSGLSLGTVLYIASLLTGPFLPGVIAPVCSMLTVILFLKLRYRVEASIPARRVVRAWIPWIYVVSAMSLAIASGLTKATSLYIPIPFLHNRVYTLLYNKTYEAVYTWSPLSHGTMIAVASLALLLTLRRGLLEFPRAFARTLSRMKYSILTILQVVGLAFLMKYSGMSITIGYALSITGSLFPLLSPFIGWLGTFITGSSTGSNALFGELQMATATSLNLSPYTIVVSNSTGGILGKIVSLQSIAIGASSVGLAGREGEIMRKLLPYSLLLVVTLAVQVYIQASILS